MTTKTTKTSLPPKDEKTADIVEILKTVESFSLKREGGSVEIKIVTEPDDPNPSDTINSILKNLSV